MTTTTATTEPANGTTRASLMKAVETNEWGQITGLEPHAAYFVMRRPTVGETKERSRQLVQDAKSFLTDQRIVTEKQVQEFQEKYGEPAKAKAKELRHTIERRFDELAKEVETRIGQIEKEFNERTPSSLKKRKEDGAASATPGAETPGEMPTGN